MTEESQDVDVTNEPRRSRRDKKKRAGASALEKIKRGRETGVIQEDELEKAEDLFEYVDDREYAKIVQKRQEEGFVLDDVDGSYCEHGREIFDEEIDKQPPKPSTGRSKKAERKRVAKPSGNVKQLLMKKTGQKKKEEVVTVKEDSLLQDLLSQYEHGAVSAPTSRARKHLSAGTSPTTPKRRAEFTPRVSSTPQYVPTQGRKLGLPPRKRFTKESSPFLEEKGSGFEGKGRGLEEKGHGLEGAVGSDVGNGGFDGNEDMDWGEDCWGAEDEEGGGVGGGGGGGGGGGVGGGGGGGGDNERRPTAATTMEKEETKVEVPEAAISASGWETVREGMDTTSQEAFSGVHVDSSLPTHGEPGDEKLSFFWLDAYEDYYRQPGIVFLFGKVWVPSAETHVSCCVVVKNIERCLYFLPREKRRGKSGQPTEEDVTFESLYREVNSRYADRYKILRFTSKRVTRKYSFEMTSVPHECEYLQVRYSTDYPAPQMGESGETFSHVFGTNTSSLERLILTCGLKGPCWLTIKQPMCPGNPISWCKCEAVINSMSSITVATEQAPPPPLMVMSLSLKITVNPKSGANEVLCVGSLVHPEIHIDKPPPGQGALFKGDLLAIRRPADRDFPFKFDEHVKRKGFNVEVSPSERAMLGYFLAKLHRADPDVIVGHNLTTFGLEVLQHRMAACQVPQWSRVGRLKRRDMPKGRMIGQLLCAGRAVVDVRTSAQELIRAKSYDLPELASTVLRTPHEPMDHENVLRAFCSNDHLCTVVSHTMNEATLSLRIMYELNVLPLAYQITCIAGNTLGRTLHGGRAERNEFLLLHAFTAKGYICPDKRQGFKKQQAQEAEGGAEGENPTPSAGGRGKRKPAYSGGLVLEPKRGFYDRFILLLDFNSLYPSIMQEYNICFTTLDHAQCAAGDDDAYSRLRLPEPSEPLGILPSEIRVLVERRKKVKQLMKEARGNPELHVEYDIRQKALKLTANSMYGCLGFPNSRFYAKPLAALVTSKGREILSNTKDLAQKLNLDVIYGDTDSIMIDSNTRDLKEAEKIAQRVKGEINKLYRLLEIDVDGIFKAMLLLRKKKYAAVAVEWRDGKMVEKRELKGLDIVRRDWSGLAKRSGHYVLDQILSGIALDEVIEKVLSYLQELQKEIKEDKVPMQEYVITKSLTKLPSDYPDKKSQAHVQVALRMQSRNQHVQAGDVIPYIMCQGDTHQAASLRAFHPEEVSKQPHLQVDKVYYLQHQVHAVVSRLCEPIQGLEPAQLAECLGLDPSSYRSAKGQEDVDGEMEEVGGVGVVDPFEGTEGLLLMCPRCSASTLLQGSLQPRDICCSKCKIPYSRNKLLNQLSLAMRGAIAKYYSGWLQCDDQACGYRTRQSTLCVEDSGPGCPSCRQGRLQEQYPASSLYRQLNAFSLIFSGDEGDATSTVIKSHIQRLLSQNMYCRIDLSRLFPILT